MNKDENKKPTTTIMDHTKNGVGVALLKTSASNVFETMAAILKNPPRPLLNRIVSLQLGLGPIQDKHGIVDSESMAKAMLNFPEPNWDDKKTEEYFNLLCYATQCVEIIAVLNSMLLAASRNPDPDPDVRAADAHRKYIEKAEADLIERMEKGMDIKEGSAR